MVWHAFFKHSWSDSELEHRSTPGQCLGEDNSWNHRLGRCIPFYDLQSSGHPKAVKTSDLFSSCSPLSDLLLTSVPPAESQSANTSFPGLLDIQTINCFPFHVAVNGINRTDNDFQDFFFKSDVSSQNIWHQKTRLTMCHIGDISEA